MDTELNRQTWQCVWLPNAERIGVAANISNFFMGISTMSEVANMAGCGQNVSSLWQPRMLGPTQWDSMLANHLWGLRCTRNAAR